MTSHSHVRTCRLAVRRLTGYSPDVLTDLPALCPGAHLPLDAPEGATNTLSSPRPRRGVQQLGPRWLSAVCVVGGCAGVPVGLCVRAVRGGWARRSLCVSLGCASCMRCAGTQGRWVTVGAQWLWVVCLCECGTASVAWCAVDTRCACPCPCRWCPKCMPHLPHVLPARPPQSHGTPLVEGMSPVQDVGAPFPPLRALEHTA